MTLENYEIILKNINKYRIRRKQIKIFSEIIILLHLETIEFSKEIIRSFGKKHKIINQIYAQLEKKSEIYKKGIIQKDTSDRKKLNELLTKAKKKTSIYLYNLNDYILKIRDKMFYNGLENKMQVLMEEISRILSLDKKEFIYGYFKFIDKQITPEIKNYIDLIWKDKNNEAIEDNEANREELLENITKRIIDLRNQNKTYFEISECISKDITFEPLRQNLQNNYFDKSFIYRRLKSRNII